MYNLREVPGETIIPLKRKLRNDRNISKHMIKVPKSLVDTIDWN